MIIVDYNQAMISSLTGKWLKKEVLTESTIRTIFIERLRTINKRWKPTYGDVLIACDGPNYWRTQYFPYYKHGRKAMKENSPLNWHLIHTMLTKFRQEIADFFPYKIIHEEGVEADDIIGHIAKTCTEKTLIFSGDSDFLQLHVNPNIDQYSPIQQKFLHTDDPIAVLKEKIIRGDPGDGIPNIFSAGNIFLDKDRRQTPITKSKLTKLMAQTQFGMAQGGWDRNQKLIDLNYIPQEILNKIDASLEQQKEKRFIRPKMLNYLFETNQSQFIDQIQDF